VLDRIDPTQERIQSASTWTISCLNMNPNKMQDIVDTWCKSIETHSQKIAMLFLANDIIQNSRNDSLRAMFQFVLPKAITAVASVPKNIPDIKKVLKVWEDRQIYPKQVIEEWEKICERIEQYGPRSDRTSLMHVIQLARTLKRYEEAQTRVKRAKEQQGDMKSALIDEQKVRGEYIVELINSMKKLYHENLNVTIYLQRINEKLDKIAELERV
jgi:hypothetical protein